MMRSPKFDPKKSRVQLSRLEDKKSSLESNSFQTDSPNPVSQSGLEYSDTNSNSDERVSEVPEMMDNKSNKNEVESMSFNLELVQSVRSITVKSEQSITQQMVQSQKSARKSMNIRITSDHQQEQAVQNQKVVNESKSITNNLLQKTQIDQNQNAEQIDLIIQNTHKTQNNKIKQTNQNMNEQTNIEREEQNVDTQIDGVSQSDSIDRIEQSARGEENKMEFREAITLENMGVQVVQKAKTIYLNVLVLGQCGIGKTCFTDMFMNKLKNTAVEQMIDQNKGRQHKHKGKIYDINEKHGSTTEWKEHLYQRQQDGNKLKLTIIDSPGYGDKTAIGEWRESVIDVLTKRFEKYRLAQKIVGNAQDIHDRSSEIQDDRIHLIMFLFDGPRAKELDLMSCKAFQKYTNVIPLIGKADTFNISELKAAKDLIMQRGLEHNVNFLKLDGLKSNPKAEVPPFAIVNPSQVIQQQDGKHVFGRDFNHGFCDAFENSDFNQLKELVFSKLKQDELRGIINRKHDRYTNTKDKENIQKERIKQQKRQMTPANMLTGAFICSFMSIAAIVGSTMDRIQQ